MKSLASHAFAWLTLLASCTTGAAAASPEPAPLLVH
jgi:hypothetical protein